MPIRSSRIARCLPGYQHGDIGRICNSGYRRPINRTPSSGHSPCRPDNNLVRSSSRTNVLNHFPVNPAIRGRAYSRQIDTGSNVFWIGKIDSEIVCILVPPAGSPTHPRQTGVDNTNECQIRTGRGSVICSGCQCEGGCPRRDD